MFAWRLEVEYVQLSCQCCLGLLNHTYESSYSNESVRAKHPIPYKTVKCLQETKLVIVTNRFPAVVLDLWQHGHEPFLSWILSQIKACPIRPFNFINHFLGCIILTRSWKPCWWYSSLSSRKQRPCWDSYTQSTFLYENSLYKQL